MKWLFAHTARQVTQASQNHVSSELEQIINDVIDQINVQASKGNFSICVDVPYTYRKHFKYHLNKMGFKIKNAKKYVEISWEKETDTFWDFLKAVFWY